MEAPKLTPAQIDAIVEENGALAKRKTIKETFSTRVQGFWAGSGMGMLYGGMMGALVALSAALVPGVGLAAAAAMIPVVAGTFAVAGMAMGATVMTAVAAPAGAAAGNAKEEERKRLSSHPNAALESAQEYREGAQESREKDSLLHKILPFNEGSKKLFSLRNALIFGAAALAAGALLLAVAPALGGGVALSGLLAAHAPAVAAVVAAHPIAATVMGLATCGLFGASFGFDGPTVAANSTQYVSDVFSGKKLSLGKSKAIEPELASLPPAPSPRATITAEEAVLLNQRLYATEKTFTQTIATQQQLQASPAGLTTGV